MSKITRRSYKRKKIIMGAALFGAVGLVSTGFAAWVLSAPAETEKAASLSVGTISDKSMEFQNVKIVETADHTNETDTYLFEPKDDDTTGRVRYDGENSELLSLTVKGNIANAQNCGEVLGKIAVGTASASRFQSAVTKNYIVAPEAFSSDDIELWTTEGATSDLFESSITDMGAGVKSMSFEYEVKFKWGSFFNGKNPGIFFDEGDGLANFKAGKKDDTLESCAAAGVSPTVTAILNDLHDLLNGVSFTLTLTANPN